MRKLRVGVIGLGIGEKHIDAYAMHSKSEVTVVCDLDQSKCDQVVNLCPMVKGTTDARKVINDPSIDIVSIASYDNYHFEQIIDSIQHNKHVFIEKPVCLFPHELKKIRSALNKKNSLHISSNLVLRNCSRFIDLKNSINSDEMGEVYAVQADYLWGRIDKLTQGWRKDMPYYSIVYGAAIHMIDLIMWLLNMKPYEVVGYGNNIATKGTELRYNDFASLVFRFKNGLIAQVAAHGGCAHPHFHSLRIYGTKRTFLQNSKDSMFVLSSEPKDEVKIIEGGYPDKRSRSGIIHSFVDSIIDPEREPIVTKEDIFDTMSVCFAAEEAIKKNKPIKVKYI